MENHGNDLQIWKNMGNPPQIARVIYKYVKSSPAYNERKVAMNRDRERERQKRENQLNGNMFSIFWDVGKSPNGGVNGEVI